MNARISVRTVTQHVTPDGRAFDDAPAAERHLAYLDQRAREQRLRDALSDVFWSDEALQALYEHDDERFKERVVDMVSGEWDLLKALAPHVPEIAKAWEERPEPKAPAPAASKRERTAPVSLARRGRG